MFALGRFLCGIGCGMTMVCQGVYLTEISPIKFRGLMGMLIGCAVEIGYTMGNVLGMPVLLGSEQRWPIIFAIDFVPSIVLLAFLFTAKESPAYLLAKGNIKSATESILYYYGKKEDTVLALRRIEQDLQMQENRLNILQVWRDRPIKNALILAILLNNAVSFSGIMAYSFFGVFLLKAIGFSEESAGYANAAAASLCIVSSITSTFVIEKTGRKKLIMTSVVGLASLNFLVMLLIIFFNKTHAHFLGFVFIALLCVFLYMFAFGIGSISWFLGSELAPPQARSSVQSLAICTQYLTGFISPIIYFPLESFVGPYSFLVFIVPLYFTAYYFHRNLPETRNREISDIMIDLGGKVNDVSLS